MSKKESKSKYENHLLLESGLSFANFTLLNGMFLIGFALLLDANEFMIGILAAIPLFANILQVFSAFIIDKTGSKKNTTIISLNLARVLWIIVIFVSFGLITYNPLILFIIVLIFSSILTAIGNLSLLAWMKDLVPTKHLSEFLGKRNAYASIGGIIVYLVASFLIDWNNSVEMFGLVFLFAIIIGVIGTFMLKDIPQKKGKLKTITFSKFKENMFEPFKNKSFKPLLTFGMVFSFATYVVSPFFIVFMLNDLGMSYFVVSIYLVIYLVARIFGLKIFGKIVDQYGSRPSLVIGTTIKCLTPFAFIFLTNSPWMHIVVFITFVTDAIGNAAIDLGLYRALFKSAPRKHDAYYLSAFTSSTNVIAAIGPIIGGAIAVLLKGTIVHPIKFLFFFSFVIRAFSISLIYKIQEPEKRSVDDVLVRMRTIRYFSFFANVYSIAEFTSKIVLFPTKQLFLLQRLTRTRMKKDVKSAISVIDKISGSLQRFNASNIDYYKERFRVLRRKLSKEVDNLDYQKGTFYDKIPTAALSEVKKLESVLDNVEIDSRKDEKAIEKRSDKIFKKIEKGKNKLIDAYERNIK
jgi:MFS family permease